jgi:hypothetical protein
VPDLDASALMRFKSFLYLRRVGALFKRLTRSAALLLRWRFLVSIGINRSQKPKFCSRLVADKKSRWLPIAPDKTRLIAFARFVRNVFLKADRTGYMGRFVTWLRAHIP